MRSRLKMRAFRSLSLVTLLILVTTLLSGSHCQEVEVAQEQKNNVIEKNLEEQIIKLEVEIPEESKILDEALAKSDTVPQVEDLPKEHRVIEEEELGIPLPAEQHQQHQRPHRPPPPPRPQGPRFRRPPPPPPGLPFRPPPLLRPVRPGARPPPPKKYKKPAKKPHSPKFRRPQGNRPPFLPPPPGFKPRPVFKLRPDYANKKPKQEEPKFVTLEDVNEGQTLEYEDDTEASPSKRDSFFSAVPRPSGGDSYGSPITPPVQDTYGIPEAPPVIDTYGIPEAPTVIDTYGTPEAPPVQDTYVIPDAPPVIDTYGTPEAPAVIDTYGIPDAPPVQDTYGIPEGPPVDTYGSPKDKPVYKPQPEPEPTYTTTTQPPRPQQIIIRNAGPSRQFGWVGHGTNGPSILPNPFLAANLPQWILGVHKIFEAGLVYSDEPRPTYQPEPPTYQPEPPTYNPTEEVDSYGPPEAPPVTVDSYGSPEAPVQQDSYGPPQAPPVTKDSYGSPSQPASNLYQRPASVPQPSPPVGPSYSAPSPSYKQPATTPAPSYQRPAAPSRPAGNYQVASSSSYARPQRPPPPRRPTNNYQRPTQPKPPSPPANNYQRPSAPQPVYKRPPPPPPKPTVNYPRPAPPKPANNYQRPQQPANNYQRPAPAPQPQPANNYQRPPPPKPTINYQRPQQPANNYQRPASAPQPANNYQRPQPQPANNYQRPQPQPANNYQRPTPPIQRPSAAPAGYTNPANVNQDQSYYQGNFVNTGLPKPQQPRPTPSYQQQQQRPPVRPQSPVGNNYQQRPQPQQPNGNYVDQEQETAASIQQPNYQSILDTQLFYNNVKDIRPSNRPEVKIQDRPNSIETNVPVPKDPIRQLASSSSNAPVWTDTNSVELTNYAPRPHTVYDPKSGSFVRVGGPRVERNSLKGVYNVPIKVEEVPAPTLAAAVAAAAPPPELTNAADDEVFLVYYDKNGQRQKPKSPVFNRGQVFDETEANKKQKYGVFVSPPEGSKFKPPEEEEIRTVYVPYGKVKNVPQIFDVDLSTSFGYNKNKKKQRKRVVVKTKARVNKLQERSDIVEAEDSVLEDGGEEVEVNAFDKEYAPIFRGDEGSSEEEDVKRVKRQVQRPGSGFPKFILDTYVGTIAAPFKLFGNAASSTYYRIRDAYNRPKRQRPAPQQFEADEQVYRNKREAEPQLGQFVTQTYLGTLTAPLKLLGQAADRYGQQFRPKRQKLPQQQQQLQFQQQQQPLDRDELLYASQVLPERKRFKRYRRQAAGVRQQPQQSTAANSNNNTPSTLGQFVFNNYFDTVMAPFRRLQNVVTSYLSPQRRKRQPQKQQQQKLPEAVEQQQLHEQLNQEEQQLEQQEEQQPQERLQTTQPIIKKEQRAQRRNPFSPPNQHQQQKQKKQIKPFEIASQFFN